MSKLSLYCTKMTVAVVAAVSLMAPTAGIAQVNVQVSGYLPAPPGVHIYLDSGRPYYLQNNRRVYVEKDRRHDNGKHRRGHGRGHGDYERWDHERGGGHGRGK
jgi:hypothetical protein